MLSPSILRPAPAQVLIVLVGDHAQLPPVCEHVKRKGRPASRKRGREDNDSEDEQEPEQCDLCKECHLAFSPYWAMMTKVQLSCQPRFSDPGYAQFLNLIRGRAPTQAELEHYLSEAEGVRHVNRAQAMDLVSDAVRSLCSHKQDVGQYNERAIKRAFPGSTIPVELLSNATGVAGLEHWLERPNFHSLSSVAIGAKVALTSNIAVEKGESCNAAAHALPALTPPPPPSPQEQPTVRRASCRRWSTGCRRTPRSPSRRGAPTGGAARWASDRSSSPTSRTSLPAAPSTPST